MSKGNPSKELWGKQVFKHVAGTAIGSAIGAAGFAAAYNLDLRVMAKLCESTKQAAVVGGVLTGLSTLGSGKTIYNLATGHVRKEESPSFASKLSSERSHTQGTVNR